MDNINFTHKIKGNKGNYIISKTYLGGTHRGVVSLGMNENTKEYVAIKILSMSFSKEKRDKLLSDVKKRIKMTDDGICSPYIVKFYDYGVLNSSLIFIVMEYIPKNIADTDEYLFRKLVDGLQCLHYNKILHSNIKPSNIDVETGKYLDLGVGCIFESYELSPYIDPVTLKTKKMTEKTDIFALGQVMYTYLFGYPVIYDGSPSDMSHTYKQACARLAQLNNREADIIAQMIHPTNPDSRPDINTIANLI